MLKNVSSHEVAASEIQHLNQIFLDPLRLVCEKIKNFKEKLALSCMSSENRLKLVKLLQYSNQFSFVFCFVQSFVFCRSQVWVGWLAWTVWQMYHDAHSNSSLFADHWENRVHKAVPGGSEFCHAQLAWLLSGWFILWWFQLETHFG